MRALNVYTCEQLAGIDGQELKNLGPGGRDWKNRAQEYIAESYAAAPSKALAVELEKLKARNQILEEDNELLKTKLVSGEAEFEDMSSDALKEYIKVNTGAAPVGHEPAHLDPYGDGLPAAQAAWSAVLGSTSRDPVDLESSGQRMGVTPSRKRRAR